MLASRTCKAETQQSGRCGANPQREKDYCFWHDPENAEEMAEARRLGGLRRRREKAVSGAYDIEGLENVGQIRRLLEVAVMDTLSLENSVARARTLAYLAQTALKTLEVGEFEERLRALESTVSSKKGRLK